MALLAGMDGCGGNYLGIDFDACEAFPSHSTWKVSLDYGGGKTATQTWTIDKYECSLSFIAQPSDEYTPGPGSTAYGFIDDPGFVAQWFNQVDSCYYDVDVTATLVGSSFPAPMNWTRKRGDASNTACVPAQEQIMASAVRQ